MKKLFPKNQSNHLIDKRCPEFYQVVRAQTERFKRSAIPSMIRMLNSYQKKNLETLKKIDFMPVKNVLFSPYHCDNKKP